MYKKNAIIVIILILALTVLFFVIFWKIKKEKTSGVSNNKNIQSQIKESDKKDEMVDQSVISNNNDIEMLDDDLNSLDDNDLGDEALSDQNIGFIVQKGYSLKEFL